MTLRTFFSYLKERFPPVVMVLLTSGILFHLYFSVYSGRGDWHSFGIFFLYYAVYLLFNFHLRLMDELKDEKKDREAYPGRLLSRNLVTISDIRHLLASVIVLELILLIAAGILSKSLRGLFFVIPLVYSFIMLKEFFVPRFLRNRITLYLITHQMIFPLLYLFVLFSLRGWTVFGSTDTVIIVTGLWVSMILCELSRKAWSKDRENHYSDSYSKAWGTTLTAWMIGVFMLLSIAFQLFELYRFGLFLPWFFSIILPGIPVLGFAARYGIHPDSRGSWLVEQGSFIYVILSNTTLAILLAIWPVLI